MDKISILFFIDSFYGLAGAERNLFEVVTRLNREKFVPIVFALQAGPALESLHAYDIQTKNLGIRKIYGIKAFKEAIKLVSFIKNNGVRIVVTYHESSDFWAGLIAKFCRVPVLISSRRDMGFNLKKHHVLFYRFINCIFDKIITVSDAVKDMIFEKENVLWNKLVTVRNGVDVDKFTDISNQDDIKRKIGIPSDSTVVGFLARVRPIKGHAYFLEAASLTLREFPKVYFLIVGWHVNQDYYNELLELTKKLNIEKNIIFTGEYPNTAEILSIFDISVLASITEGFPNAVIESMAAGKPVLATRVGGTPEAVIDGQTGILVAPRDSKALANAIMTLLRDKKQAKQMGQTGREYAKSLFNVTRMVKDIEWLFEDLLSMKISIQQARNQGLTLAGCKKIIVKIIKLLLSVCTYYSGLLLLIRKIRAEDRGIKILAYHRINDAQFDPLGMRVTIGNFEKQVRFLKKKYNIISLQQALDFLKDGKIIPRNSLVITFDDGYEDNYLYAYPILNKYKIPATIFLTVQAIEQKRMIWLDVILETFKKTARPNVDLRKFNLKYYELDSHQKKKKAIKDVIAYAKQLSLESRNNFINEMVLLLNVKEEERDGGYSLLSWEEVICMSKDGIGFGSHGMTHTILTNLSLEAAEYEIKQSKLVIKERIGIDIDLFAYPNGGRQDFNSDVGILLKKNGYVASCSLLQGMNDRATDHFALRRLCVTEGSSLGINLFSQSLFNAEISGIFKPAQISLKRRDKI